MLDSVTVDTRPLGNEQLAALRFALGESADLVFAVDLDGRVTFMNRAALARWSEVALGTPAVALFPEESRSRYREVAAAVAGGGPAARFEWGVGDVASWFACTVTPLVVGEAIAGLLCVSSDATELKRAQMRARRSEQLMVDTQGVAHLGTWEWDISEPNATWSDELYRIYALTPETYTPSYEGYLKLVHPDDRDRVAEATNRVFHDHVPYSHDERIFRPDGSLRYLHTWAYPVLDDAGKLVRLVGVCQDITDRKAAEEEVRTLNVELEARVAERTKMLTNALRDVEAFNSMVSHDLRAPLSVIQMTAGLIAREPALPARVNDQIARIHRSVEHMTALVDDLLALARVGHEPFERTRIDLSRMAADVLADLQREAPDREVEVVIEPGLVCNADYGLLHAMLTNLCSNAWKYSSRIARATIHFGRSGEAFFIRDNGAGFDMSQSQKLFAPFERLHKADEFAGTGVGLATVQRILDRHGGKIWAESAPGKGATFYFTL
jgi:signal transduction histidine kinase